MRAYVLLAVLLMLASPSAMALRCGNRLVTDGARDFQVRERCGEPFWSDSWIGVDVIGRDTPLERQSEVQWSAWYYNFGPRALMQRLVFRDGELQGTETLGYGVREIGDDCRANMDFTGMSNGELVARCGEPAARREASDTVVYRPGPSIENWREQRREEWTYDFGDTRLLRVLHLLNGKVMSVETLAR
ncbi:DUF2845 domain-containing protein [Dokdonella sp.]|uniref:DUF2845 domain-containing protein n=1 Tax=Dokdonella sp. TaxID=2291710 RepID=UPI002C31405F|nr:DUF2845 domain-containing protein [Dokdonella sp.]HOX71159.1 DUF2845 domain-containing protein [Dokdonella sp.]HPN78763.1 DUF2845 domain-containing protein [Dokdonella sp.]